MDSLLLGVGANNLEDREPVDLAQVSVGLVPHGARDGRIVVQLHAHAGLLRTLTSEDVRGRRLRDFGRTREDDGARLEVDRLDLDQAVTAHRHARVLETDLHLLVREAHGREPDVVLANARSDVVGDDLLDKLASARRRVHAVRDRSRERRERGEVRVRVDRVRVARRERVVQVGRRGPERALTLLRERVPSALEHDGLLERSAVALAVLEDGVSLGDTLALGGVIDRRDLDRDLLLGRDDVRRSRDFDGRVRRLVGVDVTRVDLEVEVGADRERVRLVVPLEPFFRLENGESLGRVDRDRVRRRLDAREGLSVVGELAAVEERRRDFKDGDALRSRFLALGSRREEEDGTLDGDRLSSLRVGDGLDARGRRDDVSRLKDGSSRENAESVREVDELEEVSIDRVGEDGLHDGLWRARDENRFSSGLNAAGGAAEHERRLTFHPSLMAKSIGNCMPVL